MDGLAGVSAGMEADTMRTANHSIQRMGASRSGQWQYVYQWRLAPTADAECSAT